MKTKLLIFLIAISCPVLSAQEVISSAGAEGKSATVQLNWTIGEPVIETLANSNNSLTQGVNQGDLTLTSVFQIKALDFKISAFPNPATEFVKLVVDKKNVEGLKYYLFDIKGKLILHKQIENSESSIFMQSYISGIYFLKIMNGNKEIKTFKIVKN